jgi:hypothetical protein
MTDVKVATILGYLLSLRKRSKTQERGKEGKKGKDGHECNLLLFIIMYSMCHSPSMCVYPQYERTEFLVFLDRSMYEASAMSALPICTRHVECHLLTSTFAHGNTQSLMYPICHFKTP